MTTKQTNKKTGNTKSFNADEREQIVFRRNYDPKFYSRGIAQYEDIPLSTIRELLEKGYLNPDGEIAYGITAQVFINFVEDHDPENWTFHGYVVSPTRQDRCVTIKGIKSKDVLDMEDVIDFLLKFRTADDLDIEDGIAHCWYD